MPGRIIKESIWTSPNLNRLSAEAERHFYRLLPCPDDFGCFEATPEVIKGRCYPLSPRVTPADIDKWQEELERQQLIIRWSMNSRQYAIFPTFSRHQHLRSFHDRRTPEPPPEITMKCQQVLEGVSSYQQPLAIADESKQVITNESTCGLNLNLNLNLNPNLIFLVWNQQKIIEHKKLTDDMKRAIEAARRDYTEEEICRAIRNYAVILKDDSYYFKYSWTLKDFLKRGLTKFLDLDVAKKNYLRDKGINSGTHKQRPRALPERYSDSPNPPR